MERGALVNPKWLPVKARLRVEQHGGAGASAAEGLRVLDASQLMQVSCGQAKRLWERYREKVRRRCLMLSADGILSTLGAVQYGRESNVECPNCKLMSPDTAIHCSCGYPFQSGAIDAAAPKNRPMQLRSVNGIGKQMLDYRPAGLGIFEATVWFTFIYIPLFPISAWLIRPAGLAGPAMSSKYSVDFVERRKLSLPSILKVYATTLAIVGPFLFAGFVFASSNPAAPHYKSTGTWFLISAVWACAWAGILRVRRDKLYERAQSATSISK